MNKQHFEKRSVYFFKSLFLPTVVRKLFQFYSLVDKKFNNEFIVQVAFLSYCLYHGKKNISSSGEDISSNHFPLWLYASFVPRRVLLLVQHNERSERFSKWNKIRGNKYKLNYRMFPLNIAKLLLWG